MNYTLKLNETTILTRVITFLIHHVKAQWRAATYSDLMRVTSCVCCYSTCVAALVLRSESRSHDVEGEFQSETEEEEVVRPCPVIVLSVVTGSSARPRPVGASTSTSTSRPAFLSRAHTAAPSSPSSFACWVIDAATCISSSNLSSHPAASSHLPTLSSSRSLPSIRNISSLFILQSLNFLTR